MSRGFAIRILVAIVLLADRGGAQPPQKRSAADVFALFCQLDAEGAQLTSDGWQKISALFVNPGTPRRDKIIITGKVGLLRPSIEGEKVGVGREYTYFGQIDIPQLQFSYHGPPGGHLVETGRYMVKIPLVGGALEWRIEGPVPAPHLTVAAAVRYITKLRANTPDSSVKANADRTLAALRRLR